MPTIKFNFIPERQIREVRAAGTTEYTVSIYRTGTSDAPSYALVFPSDVVDIYDLEGKFIWFYVDLEKKTLGWSVFEKEDHLSKMEDLRQLKKDVNKCVRLTVGRLLTSIDRKIPKSRFKIPVKVYKSLLNQADIYYINLDDENEKTTA